MNSIKTTLPIIYIILLLVLANGVSSVHAAGFLGTLTDPIAFTVAENTTSVGTVAVDPGSVMNANQVTTSVTGTDASNFSITFDSANDRVVLSFSNHTPDYETKRSYTFNATIDEPGEGEADSKVINVTITDVNEAPTLTSSATSIPINLVVTESGVHIGPIFSATDPDAVDADGPGIEDDTDINPENTGADAFRYTLTGTHVSRFDFVDVSGGVRLQTNALLDPDTDYSLSVQVFDGASDATGSLGSNIITFQFRSGTLAGDPTETVILEPIGTATAEVAITITASTRNRTRNRALRCGLGWAPQSQHRHPLEQLKVMMYALEFEFREGRYTCSAIEIRTDDATISHLADWKLYLGTLYNPSYIPIELTQANSQITNNVLRLTPEMLGLDTFPCNTVGGLSHPLPGVQYVLKTDKNVLVDTAFSCFIWGQNAYTTVNGINVESQRRISSAALRKMETPRIERYITDPTGVFITYIGIEDFGWDRIVLSDWLLAASEETVVGTPNAPSLIQKKLVTTWGALKK